MDQLCLGIVLLPIAFTMSTIRQRVNEASATKTKISIDSVVDELPEEQKCVDSAAKICP